MKNENLFSELGLALARGDVGLWVGPDGVSLAGASGQLLAAQEWLGVWAESRQPELAKALESSWRGRSSARMVIEVPDLVEDALAERSFLTKFTRCRSQPKPSCCASFKSASLNELEARRHSRFA